MFAVSKNYKSTSEFSCVMEVTQRLLVLASQPVTMSQWRNYTVEAVIRATCRCCALTSISPSFFISCDYDAYTLSSGEDYSIQQVELFMKILFHFRDIDECNLQKEWDESILSSISIPLPAICSCPKTLIWDLFCRISQVLSKKMLFSCLDNWCSMGVDSTNEGNKCTLVSFLLFYAGLRWNSQINSQSTTIQLLSWCLTNSHR